jgi:Rrf2 family nitric oxide-sensitive transcriptional repressor
MRLTRYTDYSLRVLMYVGLHGDRPCTIRDIAEGYGISENHLTKIVHGLAKLGYLRTERGRHGGLRLKGRPEAISLGVLVRQLETGLPLVECFGPDSNTCPITQACVLRRALSEAHDAFLRVLDAYRLSDLLRPATRLSRLLDLTAA